MEEQPAGVPFGRYTIERAIGRGGMGTVFRAFDSALGRVVALKTLLPAQGDETPSRAADRERFRREARAAGRLQHPNVIAVFDVGEEQGTPYFTMELIDGVRLDRWLAGEGRPDRAAPTFLDVARVIEKTARALHAAHQEGIVHRDVKPGNVLVDARDEPHLGDFGLAKAVDLAGTGALTVSGEILGTPAYMSPEQAMGEASRIGPRADVFSLGSVLYLCLAGEEPFKGSSLPNLVLSIAGQDPRFPSRVRPSVPRDIEAICLKAMEKAPGRRYASALDMAEDLARFVAGVPVRARPPSPFRGVARLLARTWPWILFLSLLGVGGWYGRRVLAERGGETERQREAHERRARAQDLLDSLPSPRSVTDRAGLEATVPVLKRAIEADPTFALPPLRRGVARQKLGDFRGALADFEEALRRDPVLAEAHFREGFLHATRQFDPEEEDKRPAAASYEAARKAAPGSIWDGLSEAALAMLYREYGAAARVLDGLATRPDRVAEVYLLRAACRGYRYASKGVRRTPVPDAFLDLEAAAADLDVAIELDPVNPWARGARGLIRFDLGDLEGARGDLTDAYRFHPDKDTAYFAARVAYMQGDHAGSMEWVGQAIELGGDSGLRRFRAFLGLLDGDYKRAMADLDMAVKSDPGESETYPIRAMVRYARGDREGGERDLAAYRERAPGVLAEIRSVDEQMSKVASLVRYLETHMRDMERVFFLSPERKQQLRSISLVASKYEWFGKMIRQVMEGRRNSPDSLGLVLDFSRIAEDRPELEGAPEFVVRGMGMKSDFILGKDGRLLARLVAEETLIWRKRLSNAKEYLARAAAYDRRGERGKALSDLEEAARRAPGDADVLYALATTRALTGDADGAVGALAQAFAAGWSHPEYTRADPDFASIAGRPEFARLTGR